MASENCVYIVEHIEPVSYGDRMSIDISDWKVTPKHMLSDFSLPLNLKTKITIFFERIDGWQLNVADKLINGVRDESGKIVDFSESAYAVLHIVLSFFEMIAKYYHGYTGNKSKYYFKEGVRLIFPDLKQHPDKQAVDQLLDDLYSGVRCGLYHYSFTSTRVFIRNDICGAIGITRQRKLLINPQILVRHLRGFLQSYVEDLRNVNNNTLRQNFEKRFDFDNRLK